MPRVGVLALQGDFREHGASLAELGVDSREVRTPAELDGVDAIIVPGGESTTIGRLARLYGLMEPLAERIESGMPALGTCAGLIFLSAHLTEGAQDLLGVLDVVVERNAFGRQNESFEKLLPIEGLDEPFPGVFIRAPWIDKIGGDVDVLATVADHPVMVRQGDVLGTAFHPELTRDLRLHRMFVSLVT